MFKGFDKLEKSWICYDVGNSAFTLLVSTIIPIWFNALATSAGLSDSQYLAYWSYATSIATVLVAVIGPVFGSIADNKNFKKPLFTIALLIGVIGCLVMGVVPDWTLYLVTFVVAKNANKTAIKLAVQEIYNIKPVAVNTVNVHPKMRRVGRYSGMTNAYKKAIVTLPEGTSIDFFSED